jgi:tetratricopeptide (TPR) repeat protein
MVGREEELKKLQEHLVEALEGQGRTVLIAGEAGVGKTRLVDELKDIAASKGFAVMFGNSMYESLTPYMPIMEALRSGGMETLFAEEAPRIEGLYLITHKGLLAKEVLREETGLDPDLFSSMLSTVGDFVRDSLSMMTGEEREGALNTLGYENYRIIVSSGESGNLVTIVSGRENEFLVNDLNEVLSSVHKNFGSILREWDGDTDKLEGLEGLMRPLISSGKYDGIFYGMDNPEGRRNLLFENVSLGLMRQAKTTPTLLCIEDLHWADPSSLAMMHYVARNTRKCNLLMLGTFRPEDIGDKEGKPHPLVETMQLMSREDLYERMELSRLPRECLSDFLSSFLGDVDFTGEFEDLVYRETEGNPLFMLELVKLLVDEGAISPKDGTWRLVKDLGMVDVPTKIHDVIVRRLDRVKQDQRKILDYASVIGEAFTSVVLSEILRLDRVELLEQLKVLQKTHRLIHPYNGCFKFDHAKIKEVLYEETPEELRTEYHALIADAIERQNEGNLDDVVGNLAYHYYHCGNKKKALQYLTKAADIAKKEYSNEEAIRFYGHALECEEDSYERIEIFKNQGDIYGLIGDYEKSIESYENSLQLAEGARSSSEIKAKLGEIYGKMGKYDKSMTCALEALELVKGEDSTEEALALIGIGRVHWFKGEYDEALRYFEKSLEIKEKIGDSEGMALSLINIGTTYFRRGDFDEALEHLERSLHIGKKIDAEGCIASCFLNIGNIRANLGEYDEAIEYYDRSLMIYERIGALSAVATLLNNIAIIHQDRGEYALGLESYEKSRKIMERIDDQHGLARALGNIGGMYVEMDQYEIARDYCERSMRICKAIGTQEMLSVNLTNLGGLSLGLGEYDKALEYCKRSLEISERIGSKRDTAYAYCTLADTYLLKGDRERALNFCNVATDLSNEIGSKMTVAYANRILGIISREQGKWEESIESFDDCIRALSEMEAKKELGRSYHDFGLMWKMKGDTEKARTYLNKALDIFEKLELESRRENVEESLANLD